MTTSTIGRDLIRAERQRQVLEEGWAPEHDMEHGPVVLLRAAWAYHDAPNISAVAPRYWPWAAEWWKPKDRHRNMERAGALAQAAFDIGGGDNARRLLDKCASWLDVQNGEGA